MGNEDRIPVSETEYSILKLMSDKGIKPGAYSLGELSRLLGVDRSKLEAVTRLLAEKGLLRVSSRHVVEYRVTDEARRYLEEGFPEERLVEILASKGGRARVEELAQTLGDIYRIAVTNAVRKGWVRISKGIVELVVEPSQAVAEERKLLRKLASGQELDSDALRLLRRRRLVEGVKRSSTVVEVPAEPSSLLERVVVEVGALTRELLKSGRWREVRLRKYRVDVEPPRPRGGRLNFFREFIEHIRDVMKEMGFVEVEEVPVETEFWNYDVLYQPQYHPARSPTDTFYLENPRSGSLPQELADRVRRAHEEGVAGSTGWRYRWSQERAARLILRSHTTAVSARVLAARPTPPFRFFTIGRVYRVEKIDSRHLPEFHQVDGIAAEDGVSFRWLLGMLAEFLERMGFREYRFRPAYFPFTEPSVEGYVRIGDKWLEILGAGLFRPEMLQALGIDYEVAAWGMGIERLAMALYGIPDIRHLYSRDVRYIETMPIRWWIYARS